VAAELKGGDQAADRGLEMPQGPAVFERRQTLETAAAKAGFPFQGKGAAPAGVCQPRQFPQAGAAQVETVVAGGAAEQAEGRIEPQLDRLHPIVNLWIVHKVDSAPISSNISFPKF